MFLSLQSDAQNPYDWHVPSTRITFIEATYMPATISFATEMAGGVCGRLAYVGQGDDQQARQANIKAVFAMLLAAKMSGASISMYGVNEGCIVRFIYIV